MPASRARDLCGVEGKQKDTLLPLRRERGNDARRDSNISVTQLRFEKAARSGNQISGEGSERCREVEEFFPREKDTFNGKGMLLFSRKRSLNKSLQATSNSSKIPRESPDEAFSRSCLLKNASLSLSLSQTYSISTLCILVYYTERKLLEGKLHVVANKINEMIYIISATNILKHYD